MKKWPAPLLQPDKKKDCLLYSVAYLCHCFGFTSVTVELVKAFRQQMRLKEVHYPEELGLEMECYWRYEDEQQWKRFWLGMEQKVWVQEHLAQEHLALVSIHRVPEMGHSVVLLEADETGVLIADPATGHVHETWEWFLGMGPGTHGCHRIEGWYTCPTRTLTL